MTMLTNINACLFVFSGISGSILYINSSCQFKFKSPSLELKSIKDKRTSPWFSTLKVYPGKSSQSNRVSSVSSHARLSQSSSNSHSRLWHMNKQSFSQMIRSSLNSNLIECLIFKITTQTRMHQHYHFNRPFIFIRSTIYLLCISSC